MQITYDQVCAIHKAFDALDTDDDGLISDEEMLGAVVRRVSAWRMCWSMLYLLTPTARCVADPGAQQVHHLPQEVSGGRQTRV